MAPRKKKRNYKRERALAKKRGETGVGHNSGDAKRHRARRKLEKKLGKAALRGKDVHHKRPVKGGGGEGPGNLAVVSKSKNRAHGGRIGNKKGKAAGGRKSRKR